MSWALSQQEIKNPAARHVLLCLANYADQEGGAAFPSVATLAKDTGLSERTVRYKLDELERAGVIKAGNQRIVEAYIDRGDRRPVCYNITIARGATNAPRSERGANETPTGCSSSSNGVQMETERGAPAAPNPSDKPSIKPSNKTVNTYAGFDVGQFDFSKWPEMPSDQVMASHMAMRKKNKYPLTQDSVDRIGNQLAKAKVFGLTVDGCIGQATESCWRGFKAEWVLNKIGGNNRGPQRGSGRPDYFRNDGTKKDFDQGVGDDGKF
jgi:hypothetical protein